MRTLTTLALTALAGAATLAGCEATPGAIEDHPLMAFAGGSLGDTPTEQSVREWNSAMSTLLSASASYDALEDALDEAEGLPVTIGFEGTTVSTSNLCTVIGRLAKGHPLLALSMHLDGTNTPPDGQPWPQSGATCMAFPNTGLPLPALTSAVAPIHAALTSAVGDLDGTLRDAIDDESDGWAEIEHFSLGELQAQIQQLDLVPTADGVRLEASLTQISLTAFLMWDITLLDDPDSPQPFLFGADRLDFAADVVFDQDQHCGPTVCEPVATVAVDAGAMQFTGLTSPNVFHINVLGLYQKSIPLSDHINDGAINPAIAAALPPGAGLMSPTPLTDGVFLVSEAVAGEDGLELTLAVDVDQDQVFVVDVCQGTFDPQQVDADGDGVGNACDLCVSLSRTRGARFADADRDGIGDACDSCPTHPGAQSDSDGDGMGDACDPCPHDGWNDQDGDGRCGDVDNCSTVPNPDQANADGDTYGDACDLCPQMATKNNADLDGDGEGDACDADDDGDGVVDVDDNCADLPNADQLDLDLDGVGDACDPCLPPHVWQYAIQCPDMGVVTARVGPRFGDRTRVVLRDPSLKTPAWIQAVCVDLSDPEVQAYLAPFQLNNDPDGDGLCDPLDGDDDGDGVADSDDLCFGEGSQPGVDCGPNLDRMPEFRPGGYPPEVLRGVLRVVPGQASQILDRATYDRAVRYDAYTTRRSRTAAATRMTTTRTR